MCVLFRSVLYKVGYCVCLFVATSAFRFYTIFWSVLDQISSASDQKMVLKRIPLAGTKRLRRSPELVYNSRLRRWLKPANQAIQELI